MKMNRLMLSAAAMASVLLLSACGKPADKVDAASAAEQVQRPQRVVDVVSVKALEDADAVEISGVLAFREETRAAFKTGGLIKRVLVREGDVIKAGTLLAALDVSEIDAAVAQAQALHEKALRDLTRGESLFAKEVISRESLDNLKTAEKAAQAGLQAARFNRGTAELRAAQDSVVIKRVNEAGEVVGPGQPVLLLGSLKSGLVFRGGLNDAQRVRIASDQPAQVRLDAWPGDTFKARILELGQASDARTGAYRVELALDAPREKTLLSGMVGRASLPVRTGLQAAWVLPLSCVGETRDDQVSVFELKAGNVVERQNLTLLQLRRDSVVVSGNISAGAQFVSSGVSYLSSGDVVTVNNLAAGNTQ